MSLAAACCGGAAHLAYTTLAPALSTVGALALAIGLGTIAFLVVARTLGLREARALRLRPGVKEKDAE